MVDNTVRRRAGNPAMGGAAVVAAQFVKFLTRFATQVVLARLLLPSDYGIVATIAPVLALVTLVADLGLGQAVILRATLDTRAISSLFWLGVAINLCLAVIVAAISPALAWFFHEPQLIGATIALAALIPLAGLAIQPSAILSRDLRFGTLALIDVVTPIAGSIAGFVAAWYGLGFWALIISSAAECALLPILVWSFSSWRPHFPAFERSALSLVRVGGHITGFNIAQYASTTAANALLAVFQGTIPLGLYDKAYKTVTLSTAQLINPVNRVIVPLLVRLKSSPDEYRKLYVSMVQLMLIGGVPGIVFVGVLAEPVMSTLLGPNWIGIAPITTWLCLGCVVAPLYASTSWLLVSQDRSDEQLRFGVIVSVISLISFIAGLPWGPTGVAAGSGLSLFFISTPFTCYRATKTGPVTGSDMIRFLTPIGIAGLAVAVALYMALLSLTQTHGVVVVELLASYLIFFLILILIPNGRAMFGMMVQSFRTIKSGKLLQTTEPLDVTPSAAALVPAPSI